MKAEAHRDLKILSEIEANGQVTQRHLAGKLGMALGLTNLYLKRLARKGYIKVTTIPRHRVRYLLTPKGIAEKTRLTYEYMQFSFSLFRQSRHFLRERFAALAEAGRKRVVFVGVGEAAELADLTLRELGLDLVAVADDGAAGSRFLDRPVVPLAALRDLEFDQAVVTSFDRPADLAKTLQELGIPDEKIFPIRDGS
jgi:DNA-binding MarR family transcriptional regulator